MREMCIVGSGVADSIMALDLQKEDNNKITLIDCDSLSQPFDSDLDLKKKYYSRVDDLKTTGYVYGGSSNLWHGVLADLDVEGYRE